MAKPIYKMYLARPTEAWYRLPKAEQDVLLAKIGNILPQVGAKSVIICSSSWATEQWVFWGVEEYPDLEALQRADEMHRELNWYRYVDSMSSVGTAMES